VGDEASPDVSRRAMTIVLDGCGGDQVMADYGTLRGRR
jgi:hypothetical protein